jgi:hypothetical protein
VFLACAGLVASRHEMWRDEMQAWLMSRDSATVIDVFRILKYEGHPMVWYLCLWVLKQITWSPAIMQVLHVLIATATILVFARFAPFNRLQKVLFAFGYFPFYEYAVISRNYAIGLLLICVYCALFPKRRERFLLLCAMLFLLAHTSAVAMVFSAALGLGLLVESEIERRREAGASLLPRSPRFWIGSAIIALGVLTCILHLAPPEDYGMPLEWRTFNMGALTMVLQLVFVAFLPIPVPSLRFWNFNWLEMVPVIAIWRLLLGSLLFTWCVLAFLRRPSALLTYVAGTSGLLAFYCAIYFGYTRHFGFLFILLVVVCWLREHCAESRSPWLDHPLARPCERSLGVVLGLLLAVHAVGGLMAAGLDYRHVFSGAKQAAGIVRAHGLQDLIIAGHEDYSVTGVLGYLEKDRFYYPRGDRFGSYIVWDMAVWQRPDPQAVLERVQSVARRSAQDAVLVLNAPLEPQAISRYRLESLGTTEEATVADEQFWLYRLRVGDPAPPAP